MSAGGLAGRSRKEEFVALLAVVAITVHLILRFGLHLPGTVLGAAGFDLPLLVALAIGGGYLLIGLVAGLFRGQFSSDLLAGISIVTSVVLGEYLAGSVVVLMLSGGQALEAYAARRASSVLEALARRMPAVAHRQSDGAMADISLAEVAVGDRIVIFPHETCPVDGTVLEGHGTMDESYLTGEPYHMSKAPGVPVLSGSINGESALTIRADRLANDSRYASIMRVMKESEQRRPRLRRLGDQLGAVYTPVAIVIALAAWLLSGEATRFLAVLVVATPCPLLIAIPVAVIGSISLAARRGIIVRDPAILEMVDTCQTAMFDKTGTLTYGQPRVTEVLPIGGHEAQRVLGLTASLERYSRHPLAGSIVDKAESEKLVLQEASSVSEPPGQGLTGVVGGLTVRVTGRSLLLAEQPEVAALLPPAVDGMECLVLIDDQLAGALRFRDEPRQDGASFIRHLKTRHRFKKVMLVSGDRESEVRYLADKVGITEIHSSQTPEQKVALVREETKKAPTIFLGDGINDAPALTAATVGIAFGQASDVTSEAAGAVILESSLERVDELFHIGRRMRVIALQSAIGGMALSIVGMILASMGYLSPVAGAVAQEVIDVLAVLNALRAAMTGGALTDYDAG